MGRELLGEEGEPELNTIAPNSHDNVIKCRSGNFHYGLKDNLRQVGGNSVISALTNVNLVSLAANVENFLTPSIADPQGTYWNKISVT